MTSTDPLDLDAIETRANAATPGPWEEHPDYGKDFYAYLGGPYLRGIGTLNFGDGEDTAADREFVKHARTDVDALLAEVRRLHDRVTELEGVANCQSTAAINGARCSLPVRHRGDHHTADRRHYWSDEHATPAAPPAADDSDGLPKHEIWSPHCEDGCCR